MKTKTPFLTLNAKLTMVIATKSYFNIGSFHIFYVFCLFFLAFLPQFVVPGAGPVGAQMFLHGSLIIVVAALIEPLLVFTGSRLAASLSAPTTGGNPGLAGVREIPD